MQPEEASPDVADMEEAAVRQLEQELSTTRDDLQGHIEQLKSLNEELHSSNEELQAANEELETSREELQSLNEELTTVNGQLQTKIEDEEETNNDLANFLASTSIPTIFLDHRLRVKRFTPAMVRLIKLLPGDVGRPIIDMSQAHLGPELVNDAQSVLDNLTPVIRELAINGGWYVRSALPYRTSDNRIEGVVITYTDITERKRAEESLRVSEEGLRLLVEGARDYALFMLDESGHVASWNMGAERIKGWTSQEILGRHFSCFYPLESVDRGQPQRELEIAATTGQYHEEGQRLRKDGSRFWADITITALCDADGRLRGFAKLTRDITERKQAEERTERLASYPQLNPDPIIEVDASGKITFFNRGSQAILEKLGLDKGNLEVLLPHDMDDILRDWDKKNESTLDCEVSLADIVLGETIHFLPQLKVVRVYAHDITERKRAEEALRISEKRYRTLFETMTEGFAFDEIICDESGKPYDLRYLAVNPAFERQTGLKAADIVGRTTLEVFPEAEPVWFERYGKVALTGEPAEFEESFGPPGHWFKVSSFQTEPGRFAVVFTDITERKRAEEALRRSHDELEERVLERTEALRRQADLLELAYNAIIVRDLDGRVTFWNARAEDIYGFTRDEALGRVTHTSSRPGFPCPLRNI